MWRGAAVPQRRAARRPRTPRSKASLSRSGCRAAAARVPLRGRAGCTAGARHACSTTRPGTAARHHHHCCHHRSPILAIPPPTLPTTSRCSSPFGHSRAAGAPPLPLPAAPRPPRVLASTSLRPRACRASAARPRPPPLASPPRPRPAAPAPLHAWWQPADGAWAAGEAAGAAAGWERYLPCVCMVHRSGNDEVPAACGAPVAAAWTGAQLEAHRQAGRQVQRQPCHDPGVPWDPLAL